MLDLVLPLECGGCAAPGTRWCPSCEQDLQLGPGQPELVTPRVDPGVPVFALGRYAGPRRKAIIAAKEHGRTDLIAPLAIALAEGLQRLVAWGLIEPELTLVPAPTRWAAARRRGGDPVARMAVAAAAASSLPITAQTALRMRAFVRDSVGLSSADRERNVAGRVRQRKPIRGTVLLIDDIVTTGATAAESVRVLQTHGSQVTGVFALAYA